MATYPDAPLRDFQVVEAELRQILMRLRNKSDSEARIELLLKLRLLLDEVDQIIALDY